MHNGQVSRIRASEEKGAEREMAVSATNDERSKLDQRLGRPELVVQLEGPPPEPALIETRFWFENGAYHFQAQATATYEASVAKQWHGALVFHGAGGNAGPQSLTGSVSPKQPKAFPALVTTRGE